MLHICVLKFKSPEFRGAEEGLAGVIEGSSQGAGRKQAEQGSPDALGMMEGTAGTSASVGHLWVTRPKPLGYHMGSLHAYARAWGRSGRPQLLPSLALT